MSAYSNYAPPPTTMGQMNMINGVPQQHSVPQQLQPQQQQQQQMTGSQIQQQQQNILQQKQSQQQQFLPGAIPPMINNMSKFMPPSAAATTSGNNAATSAAAVAGPNAAFNALNGPRAAAPPSTQAPPSNIPPHLRPTGMNGPPPAGSAVSAVSTPLTNGGGSGGGGNFSANSSRTGSPALQNSPSHHHHQQQQQQQQQYPPGAVGAAKPPLSSPQSVPSVPKFEPAIKAAAAAPPGLANSMQNLSLNRTNGPSTQSMQQPPLTSASTNSFPSNFQGNFRTSALNTNPQQQQQNPATSFATNRSPQMPPTSVPYNQQFTSQAAQQQLPKTQTVTTTSVSQPPSSIYGTSTAPLMMRPPQAVQQNVGYGPPTAGMVPSTNVLQQNQLNNNQAQQPFGQQQQQQQQPQPPPPPLQQARKPMYPTTSQLPPLHTPQQQQQQPSQQQQPYSQAYHQQQHQLQAAATFNGQTNAAPLQYQPMQQPQQQQYPAAPNYNPQMSIAHQGFSRLWGQDTVDLMQNRHILTPATLPIPKIVLHNQFHESINCNPSIMRCTIAKIPESNSLLQKSRLPLGILIHPFRDVNSLPVIQCPNIVRCRLCRTYINPFVYFVDSKMWKCNLCYRVNELPEDFQFDPATKTYGDVTRRPEVRSSTIEFIAPSEYMLRPPQPAIYLFLFDVSIIAQQSGYLENICAVLSKHLDDMPGDARTQVGFIAYNSQLHFYSMAEGYNQPHEMTLLDIDDPFLPRPDNLLVNLKECKELIKDLLTQLPKRFADTHDPGSALGAALQVAYKLMQASGGRVTVFQTCLPNKGPGALEAREDPNNRSAKDVAHLNPATDFYKRYALECSGYQIAVDLFLLNQQYSDLATISGISKHSGGCVHHFPLYQQTKLQHIDSLKQCFKRYLVRKIGFEAVMRIRCTRGLQVHTFHGNFFVRSTDLLSLPNVNPDAGYGMQISYEESLTDVKTICFQAALLYTNSEGERRIRVHTLCLPVTASLPEVMHAADTEAIIGLLSKMAVDRSITSNIADAREAFINATVDILSAFKIAQNLPSGQTGQLIAPRSLALMPLYILSLLKHPAFRVGTSTRLDDRVYAMDCMKTLPLDQLMKFIYPEFYQIDALFFNAQNSNNTVAEDDEDDDLPDLPRLQLSAEYLDSRSIFLLDCGNLIIIYVGLNVPVNILENVLGIKATAELPDYYYGLPAVNSAENDLLKRFIMRLNDDKPYPPVVQIIRDTSTAKPQLIEKLVDDRSESSLSYYEFLQHIRTQVK